MCSVIIYLFTYLSQIFSLIGNLIFDVYSSNRHKFAVIDCWFTVDFSGYKSPKVVNTKNLKNNSDTKKTIFYH